MPGKLENQVAIVTGGNSGIGKTTALLFASEGAKVGLLARREKEGLDVENAIKSDGGEAMFVSCDVADHQQVDDTVEKIVSAYGGVDILFNNAGGGDRGNFPDETDEGWERVSTAPLR